jgi:2-hydroxychromene-2-carboxylate isomerase
MQDNAPDGFPPLTLTIMRALCALTVLHEGQAKLIKTLDVLYHDYWVEHKKTNEKNVLAEILGRVLGKEDSEKGRWFSAFLLVEVMFVWSHWKCADLGVTTVMEMAGKEGKELLAKNTDRALADGAFGLPWFVATNIEGKTETFWGVDHLGQVTAHLGLEKPKTGGWKALL